MKDKLEFFENKLIDFCRKHKKGITITIGMVATLVKGVTIIRNSISDGTDKENYKYSDDFFRDASDEELNYERERVRVKRNSCYDDTYDDYYNLLNKFDNVLINRANEKYRKENPNPKQVDHNGGWYYCDKD